MDATTRRALRALPAVDAFVRDYQRHQTIDFELELLVQIARQVVDEAREQILDGNLQSKPAVEHRLQAMVEMLTTDDVRTVINGTGVIVHTNLGRSPVSKSTARAMAEAACNYLPLEVRLESAERGGRGERVAQLFGLLTGAEDGLVVNNNAAAILLTLSALCAGKRVIVSRGEAVEIGGGFRVPDVMRQSGAELVEVGTTNRTNLADYAAVIDNDTVAILTVHASNFQITGFTGKPLLSELASLAHENGILLIEDVGSGCLVDTENYGLAHEPTLRESLDAGVDIVTASGDKLLGGPQAGVILGTQTAVDIVRRHPLARAVRTDKSVLEGLAATLRHYVRGDFEEEVPIWWMMSRTVDQLLVRAESWRDQIGSDDCHVIETTSVVGGGSLPGKSQPSIGLALQSHEKSAGTIAHRLRTGHQSVFARVENDQVIVDARTVLADQDQMLVAAIRDALGSSVG